MRQQTKDKISLGLLTIITLCVIAITGIIGYESNLVRTYLDLPIVIKDTGWYSEQASIKRTLDWLNE